MPLSIKGRIILEILEAMVYLSERRIIHKDLKPENILVDKDFHIKVQSHLGMSATYHCASTVRAAEVFPSLSDCRPWPGHLPNVEQAHKGGVPQEEPEGKIDGRQRSRHTELHGSRAPGQHTHRLYREI